MLIIAICAITVGYTLVYAGMRPGKNDKYALAPWLLLVDASKQLNAEAAKAAKGTLG